MEMDYRELCAELFGTDNEDQLRKIAQNMKKNREECGPEENIH